MTTVKSDLEVPDGGWGWMVVAGSATTNMFNQSLVSLFGLLFGQQLGVLGHGTSEAAFVMNLNSVVTNFSGLVTGPMLKKYSVRSMAVAGSLLTASGLVISSQAHSLWLLIFGYSILTGLGLGFIMPSVFLAVTSYFKVKRGRAVGLAAAGTGLGQMIMPHAVRSLLDDYGFRGATLIMGAMALQGVVGASLFQPVRRHMRLAKTCAPNERKTLLDPSPTSESSDNENDSDTKKLLKKDCNDCFDCAEAGKCNGDLKLANGNADASVRENGHANGVAKMTDKDYVPLISVQSSCWQKFINCMDLDLLKDLTFLNIVFGVALAYTASINFSMLFPFFLQESAGLNRADTATCMSVLAGADIVSRVTLPAITQLLGLSCRVTFLIGAAALIAARALLAEQSDLAGLVAMSALCGYVRAATVVNQNLVLSEHCNSSRLPAALGLGMCVKGAFVISLGQLLGWLRDYTGSYSLCIHAQNILLLTIVATWLPEILYKRCKKKNEKIPLR